MPRLHFGRLKVFTFSLKMAEQSKIVKTVTDAAVLVGLASAIGWVGKKVLKENLTGDPSSSFMNYGEWVGLMTGCLYLKDYLTDKKVIPDGF